MHRAIWHSRVPNVPIGLRGKGEPLGGSAVVLAVGDTPCRPHSDNKGKKPHIERKATDRPRMRPGTFASLLWKTAQAFGPRRIGTRHSDFHS